MGFVHASFCSVSVHRPVQEEANYEEEGSSYSVLFTRVSQRQN